MQTLRVLGIVGNTLYIDPFYGGDQYHEATLTNHEVECFKSQGIPIYSDIDHIECQLYGMTHQEYLDMRQQQMAHQSTPSSNQSTDNDLPF